MIAKMVSPDLAAAFAYRDVTVLRALGGGNRNRVFLVERNGDRFVAKTTTHGEDSLRWQCAVQAMARCVEVASPPLVADAEGRLAAGGLTLEHFIVGACGTPETIDALMPRVRRMHATLRGWKQRPGYRLEPWAPRNLQSAYRHAMQSLPDAAATVVHGDLTPANLVLTPTGPVVLDWDEARVDHPVFDMPLDRLRGLELRARLCREIVAGWRAEPAYARRLARKLRAMPAPIV